jgi:nucleoside-diphosphate-sugar epimerase
MASILVSGASGYVGSELVPTLLKFGYEVVAVDTFWFGDFLDPHPNLKKIEIDVRYLEEKSLPDIDYIIHLAAVANDPSVDLDPTLSWEIGSLGTLNLCNIGRAKKIKAFILASSGSVYGIKDEPKVTEDLSLVPISVYNKVKMIKERIVISFSNEFRTVVLRPATICGWSRRLRLDLAVNALTFNALKFKKIKVFGGSQMRPQLHIQDMVNCYVWAIKNDEISGVYNLGFENDSILEIAEKVQSEIEAEIEILESNDPRSYRLDSSKILAAGFVPKLKTIDAILELQSRYLSGDIEESPNNYNVNWMKENLGMRTHDN